MVCVNSNGNGETEDVYSEVDEAVAVDASNKQRTTSDTIDQEQHPYHEAVRPEQMQLFSSQEDSAERTPDDDFPPSPTLSSKMNVMNDSIRKQAEAKSKPNF